MTTLVAMDTSHDDQRPTDDERRTQWRKRAGTLPPDGSHGVVLQLVDAADESDSAAWTGLFLGSLWATPEPQPVKRNRSHRRISAATPLRATA